MLFFKILLLKKIGKNPMEDNKNEYNLINLISITLLIFRFVNNIDIYFLIDYVMQRKIKK